MAIDPQDSFLGSWAKVTPLHFSMFGGREHVVTPKGNGLKLANAPLMTFGRIEGEPRFGARNEEFNPPLRVREGLVGDYLQPQCFRIEVQRNALIVNRNADKLAESVGLSKSSAQTAVSWLVRRKLLAASKENATAIPSYTVRSPWRDAARRVNLRRGE